MTSCILGVLLVATSLSNAEKNETAQNWNVTTIMTTTIAVSTTTTAKSRVTTELGPKLKDFACHRPDDCSDVDGTYCDADAGFCLCKPDYPVTDTNHCYKESKYDEFCRLDIQCQRRDKNTKCNRDFNMCECSLNMSRNLSIMASFGVCDHQLLKIQRTVSVPLSTLHCLSSWVLWR